MRIIVAGDGKVGLELLRLLSEEGHELVAIDSSGDVLKRQIQNIDVMTVEGNCAAMSVLQEAGIEHTDILIAVTGSDEINLLCCLTAKNLHGAVHTIARVRSPEYTEQLYLMREDYGLSLIINPEKEAAEEISRLLQLPGFLKRETFAKGRVELVELLVNEGGLLQNTKLMDLPRVLGPNCNVLVCAVIRGDEVFIPTGGTTLLAGDHIYVTAPVTNLSLLLTRIGVTRRKIRHALLIGGGRVSYYLTQQLLLSGVRVKIIERDEARAAQLATMLPEASIILDDGASPEALVREGITETDALVTLTGIDEQNVLTSMYGSTLGVPLVATKVDRIGSTGILENLSVGSVVSPKETCSAHIVQYVRAMENQAGAAVTLHRVADGRVEALEFVVNEKMRFIGEPLKNLHSHIKKNILISCITHRGRTVIPDGNAHYEKNDTVIVINGRESPILQFNDIFE